MTKSIISIGVCLFLCVQLQAQKGVQAIYKEVITWSNGDQDHVFYELVANPDQSLFRYSGNKNDTTTTVKETGDKKYIVTKSKTIRNGYHINFGRKALKQVYQDGDGQLRQINDPKVNLNWKITEESKTIGKYMAIKALVSFRGRDYIAWFAPEIPIKAGPWKFYGLPGLIVNVYDQDHTFEWQLSSLVYPIEIESKSLKVDPAKIDEELSLKEFVREKERKRSTKISRRNAQKGVKVERTKNYARELKYEWE